MALGILKLVDLGLGCFQTKNQIAGHLGMSFGCIVAIAKCSMYWQQDFLVYFIVTFFSVYSVTGKPELGLFSKAKKSGS